MQGNFRVEELVVDDTFINYCFGTNRADVLFWQNYLAAYPFEKEKIEEAKEMVLGLREMLRLEYEDDATKQEFNTRNSVRNISFKRIIQYSSAAAAVLIIIFVATNWSKNIFTKQGVSNKQLVFTTAKAQRNVFLLPDSTKVYLNASSSLTTDKDFGNSNRTVFLTGEALFDVKHNPHLPFIVHLEKYDIKVLGTLFNAKSYPGETTSETSLLRGKVQIIKKDGGDLTLVPNQKVIFKNIKSRPGDNSSNSTDFVITSQKIVPLSNKDGLPTEAAWAYNRLEIVNEAFEEIKDKLERWYDVKIVLKDDEVAKYTFTATFEKENIEQVMRALQYSYPFNYVVEKDRIIISK